MMADHMSERRRMNWDGKFAEACNLTRRNTIREFLKFAGQPGIISFAGGLPAPEVFPVKEISAAADRVLSRHPAQALQYGATEGLKDLREAIAARYRGMGVTSENVLITTGAQQALDLIGRVFLNSGDAVLVENPTYLALLSAWRPLGADFRGLQKQDGRFVLDREQRAKLLYCVPNFQNPSGTTLSLEGRLALLSQAGETIIIEDDPYGELRYEGEPLPSILELGGGVDSGVIAVGTFSKVLAPGFRVGWIVAGGEAMERLVRAKQSMDLHTSTFAQWIVQDLISSGVLERQIPLLRDCYRSRRDAMLSALARHIPSGLAWTHPEGGMFLLATLSEGSNAHELAQRALDAGVLIIPGADFHVCGGHNTFRLNFTHPNLREIEEGISRLAKLISSEA
jgi:2-aminoadipate transaminase